MSSQAPAQGEVAGLAIRPGRIEDAGNIHAALLGIAETIGELHKVKSTPDDMRRDGFGAKRRFQTLVAEVDGAFAGLCLYFPIYSTWMGRPGAYVQDLFVAEAYRGLGIGEKLLRHLAREVKREGGVYIELVADTGNFAAQRFYERVGIAHQGDDQVHRISGEAFAAFADFAGDR